MFGAQSAGCSPIATAFDEGDRRGAPGASDRHRQVAQHRQPGRRPVRARCGALDRRRDGAVDDDEIREGIRLLARTTGVFAETAGGVTVAVLRKLVKSGAIDTSVETVVYNTGDGLKTIDAVSEGAAPTAIIAPTLKGMREAGLL